MGGGLGRRNLWLLLSTQVPSQSCPFPGLGSGPQIWPFSLSSGLFQTFRVICGSLLTRNTYISTFLPSQQPPGKPRLSSVFHPPRTAWHPPFQRELLSELNNYLTYHLIL